MSDSTEKLEPAIAVVVLAAGQSGRLGRPKQLLRCGDESLLRRAARIAVESGVGPVFIVLSRGDEQLRRELAGLAVTLLFNDQPEAGMSGSIRLAVDAARSAAGVILATCDQLAVTAGHFHVLAAELRRPDVSAVASGYAGTFGIPAAFSLSLFDQLMHLSGDRGAKLLLQQLGERATILPLPGGERDIDTPADVENLL